MDGWSITQYMIIFSSTLLKIGEARPVNAGPLQVSKWFSNIAFHLRPFWLQTLVLVGSNLCSRSFPSFSTPPSEVVELFTIRLESWQTPISRTVNQSKSAALDSIWSMWICSHLVSLVLTPTPLKRWAQL